MGGSKKLQCRLGNERHCNRDSRAARRHPRGATRTLPAVCRRCRRGRLGRRSARAAAGRICRCPCRRQRSDSLRGRPRHATRRARTRWKGRARQLAAEGACSAWRNERYAVVREFGDDPAFELERCAARYFGIRTFAAHINGLVRADDGRPHVAWPAQPAQGRRPRTARQHGRRRHRRRCVQSRQR